MAVDCLQRRPRTDALCRIEAPALHGAGQQIGVGRRGSQRLDVRHAAVRSDGEVQQHVAAPEHHRRRQWNGGARAQPRRGRQLLGSTLCGRQQQHRQHTAAHHPADTCDRHGHLAAGACALPESAADDMPRESGRLLQSPVAPRPASRAAGIRRACRHSSNTLASYMRRPSTGRVISRTGLVTTGCRSLCNSRQNPG